MTYSFSIARQALTRRLLLSARTTRTSLAILLVVVSAPLAAEEIHIGPGFTLELSALGVPGFRFKATVNPAGEVTFPLLDSMRVEGLSLNEVRDRLRELLSKRPFRQRTPDGRENYFSISPDEVSIEIVEYPPVYVSGDVAKPGEQAFRPGLTIRQAIAVAGGVDLVQRRFRSPLLEMADARSETEGAWLEYAKQRAKQIALQAELDGRRDPDFKDQIKTPLAPAIVDRIATLEAARLSTAEDDYRKEFKYLQDAAVQMDAQLSTLQEEKASMDATLRQSAADLERLRGLYQNQTVSMNRLSDEQRQFSYATERRLQVISQITAVDRLRSEMRRKLEAAPDQRRLKLLSDAQETSTRIEILRARVRSLDEKLALAGVAANASNNTDSQRPVVVIFRRAPNGTVRLQGREDDALYAGDVVEVASGRIQRDEE